jgi:hypothetical protein
VSKWNRPMRRYRPDVVRCVVCGDELRQTQTRWVHVNWLVERLGITDPRWHIARVS